MKVEVYFIQENKIMIEEYTGKDLYESDDVELMEKAYKAILKSKKSRIRELIELCNELDFKKIGIAYCRTMEKYAMRLDEILTLAGFETAIVSCKIGGLKNEELFEEAKGISCNPAYQAKFLREANTDINVNVGLCLGHELMFMKKSNAPVTTVLVKDFCTNHNIAESLLSD